MHVLCCMAGSLRKLLLTHGKNQSERGGCDGYVPLCIVRASALTEPKAALRDTLLGCFPRFGILVYKASWACFSYLTRVLETNTKNKQTSQDL